MQALRHAYLANSTHAQRARACVSADRSDRPLTLFHTFRVSCFTLVAIVRVSCVSCFTFEASGHVPCFVCFVFHAPGPGPEEPIS